MEHPSSDREAYLAEVLRLQAEVDTLPVPRGMLRDLHSIHLNAERTHLLHLRAERSQEALKELKHLQAEAEARRDSWVSTGEDTVMSDVNERAALAVGMRDLELMGVQAAEAVIAAELAALTSDRFCEMHDNEELPKRVVDALDAFTLLEHEESVALRRARSA